MYRIANFFILRILPDPAYPVIFFISTSLAAARRLAVGEDEGFGLVGDVFDGAIF